MSDYIFKPDFSILVTTRSRLAFCWNNESKDLAVKNYKRYKIRGGRLTGNNAQELREKVKIAIQREDLVLLVAGANDVFDPDTRKIRFIEEKVDNKGKIVQYNIIEEIKTFYSQILEKAIKENTTLIILLILPRYFEKKENSEYYLPQEKLLRKINNKFREFIESQARTHYRINKKWIKVRFIDLTTYFLKNITQFFQEPERNVHLGKKGRQKLVTKLKEVITEVYKIQFIQVGRKITCMLTDIEEKLEL